MYKNFYKIIKGIKEMNKNRSWSARHARLLSICYKCVEGLLSLLHPIIRAAGYKRVDPKMLYFEKSIKKALFDSKSCGQCTLMDTGMVCPMNCPKTLRNGPCGGVRANGNCEIKPEMTCVWVTAWQGSEKIPQGRERFLKIQPPLDVRLSNTSAWLRVLRNKKEALNS